MRSSPNTGRRHARRNLIAAFVLLSGLAILLASCGAADPTPLVVAPATAAQAGTPSQAGSSATQAVAPTPPLAPTPPTAASRTPRDTPPPSSTPAATSAFALLTMATAADPAKPAPDPATYAKVYRTSAPAIYVVFSLAPGLVGDVRCAITANGARLMEPLNIAYGRANAWGDFRIRSLGRFDAGAYVATLTYVPTGESATVNFTVSK